MGIDGGTGGVSGNGGAPCLAAPLIPIPPLPLPFGLPTLGISLPKLSFTLCCTITLPWISLTLPIPPIPLGLLGAAVIALVQLIVQGVGIVNKYLSMLVLPCPIQ